jgi:hypothetical protein
MDSSVGIATGWTAGRAGARDFQFLHSVQTGSGAHPTSYSMGTGGSFLGGKAAGREADHSPPSSAQVKMMDLYLNSPKCFHGVVLN